MQRMDPVSELPFQVGQLVESMTFLQGFRGAWFRCKIKKIESRGGGRKRFCLEYFDFPDEKERWTVLYQKTQSGRAHQGEMRLMVRPHYPPLYKENQMPDLSKISETTLIVNDAWRVDDLVDWWCDNCYWSGRVTQLLEDDKVQVVLLAPPSGEGGSYDGLCTDLRPSLDWSAENGWNVPVPEGNDNEAASPCARLLRPLRQNRENTLLGDPVENCNIGRDPEESNKIGGVSVENNLTRLSESGNSSSLEISSGEPKLETREMLKASCSGKHLRLKDKGTGNLCQQNEVDASPGASKRKRVSKNEQVSPAATPDAINSAIMDLEETVNKVKWLKNVLKFGFGWSNAMKPSWMFIENDKPSRHGCN
ncbi:hypothetical protein H6P81_004691 [Aristolochia fimbriata]|uniref:Agenet domain-containing protein n=1 Tax=Aristolochia fimbriata TaxID=158543 RepID=A0AAV7EVZ0_ARIFI|nr:hypothetical protein H6P81_004691 [Aristolochia fimbriata]